MTEKFDVWFRNKFVREGICRAIYDRMEADDGVYLIGEGAHMKVHFDAPYIETRFPNKVLTLPISEDGNSNFAVGMALAGLKPINDVIVSDFLYRTMDSICNTAVKTNYVHKKDPMTMVFRSEFLVGGPTNGQRPESLFAHIPGLNVIIPSTPNDAYGLMLSALTQPGISIFFEDRMIKDEELTQLDEKKPVQIGKAAIIRRGDKLTVVSYGLTMQRAIKALKAVDAELVDIRGVSPIDYQTIIESVKRTGKLLVVEPDVRIGGIGGEIIATVQSQVSERLHTSILGSPYTVIPASSYLNRQLIPSEEVIAHTAQTMVR